MARQYIKQQNVTNFIYPNAYLAEYDTEIVHNINNNPVSGAVINFSATTVGSNVVINFDYEWYKNGCEPYIDNNGQMHLFSVHMMDASTVYYKPWRCVSGVTTSDTTANFVSGHFSATVTPTLMQLSGFTSGQYFFEIRFIGKRAIDPIGELSTLTFVQPTPTPTPTVTPTNTPGLPTPTPTPSPQTSVSLIGTGFKVGATDCTYIADTPQIYLNSSDYAKYQANGGCLSDGGTNNVAVIRNSDGSPISGTFYFVWYGSSCSTTTFKSTNGNLTTRSEQC